MGRHRIPPPPKTQEPVWTSGLESTSPKGLRRILAPAQFRNASGHDTVTLTGTISGTTLSGTYSDSQGDAGTWTATLSGSPTGTYRGSVNSTPNPLQTAPLDFRSNHGRPEFRA